MGVGGVTPPPLIATIFPCWTIDISFQDDVNVILLLSVSFVTIWQWFRFQARNKKRGGGGRGGDAYGIFPKQWLSQLEEKMHGSQNDHPAPTRFLVVPLDWSWLRHKPLYVKKNYFVLECSISVVLSCFLQKSLLRPVSRIKSHYCYKPAQNLSQSALLIGWRRSNITNNLTKKTGTV